MGLEQQFREYLARRQLIFTINGSTEGHLEFEA